MTNWLGLGRAAATAGIPSVLCTLWNIDDQSASVFFRAFYAALIEGESKDRAITRAQRIVRESGFTSPFHWAPFALMGDWRGIHTTA